MNLAARRPVAESGHHGERPDELAKRRRGSTGGSEHFQTVAAQSVFERDQLFDDDENVMERPCRAHARPRGAAPSESTVAHDVRDA